MNGYVFLAIAIFFEVMGTSLLKMSQGFAKLHLGVGAVLCFIVALYCLSQVLLRIPVGTTYAIWSAVGIVVLAIIGVVVYGERPDLPALIGFGLIVAGVISLTVFSKMRLE